VEIDELYRRIASVTTKYTFTAPVTVEDLSVVRDELARAVGADYRALVLPATDAFVRVDVYLGAERVYHRMMLVQGRGE
jgi:hypothetical protein